MIFQRFFEIIGSFQLYHNIPKLPENICLRVLIEDELESCGYFPSDSGAKPPQPVIAQCSVAIHSSLMTSSVRNLYVKIKEFEG